ncbi:PepSY domain-containing protein [Microbulbifer hainanensis]|uniref:PepSY domain-containing protein n=1 Tax=Microbulbifer hainanensis TaxID=2735675 RepID=UPI0018661D01|nr:PepSY domain-containing protein [Microbulbifer hainanensis]
MKTATISRKIHKWIFLIIGVQALLWTLSGFYMVVMDLDFIHGDHLVRNLHEPLPTTSTELFPTEALIREGTGVKSVQLKSIRKKLFYVVRDSDGKHLLDAHSGIEISPLDRQTAIALAEYHYSGDFPANSAELITQNPPSEIQFRPLPLWRVNFDDRYGTSLYIDPNTGALATRRHDYWRAFDFFWMLHIMDYKERDNIHNPLLLAAALFSLVSVLAGLVLLFYSFGKRRAANPRQQRETTA